MLATEAGAVFTPGTIRRDEMEQIDRSQGVEVLDGKNSYTAYPQKGRYASTEAHVEACLEELRSDEAPFGAHLRYEPEVDSQGQHRIWVHRGSR